MLRGPQSPPFVDGATVDIQMPGIYRNALSGVSRGLELVVTPGADVVLTGTGSALLRGKVNARKKLLKEQQERAVGLQSRLRTLLEKAGRL